MDVVQQLRPLEINTYCTLEHDRHFLLVDGKVSLEEDAENDPCDLHKEREKRNKRAVSVQRRSE